MAEQTLDVYRDWLGIKDATRPLNHYQLIRLKTFEDDVEKIRANYRKLNSHVRKYATGKYGSESQQLLNELAKAMLCLTDDRRKREYDASLGRKSEKQQGQQTLEEILLTRKQVDPAQLEKARKFSDVTGLEVREALVQQKVASPDVVTQAYADSIGLPFLKISELQIQADVIAQVPAVLARQQACVPILIDDGHLLVASPNVIAPDVEEELRLRTSLVIRTVLCTPTEANAALDQFYSRESAEAELKSKVTSGEAEPGTTVHRTPEQEAELKKELRNVALLSFNFSFMAVALVQFFREQPLPQTLVPAIAVGGVVAATAYVLTSNRRG